MWAYETIFYQIYPIGFCGAPTSNDGNTVPRIRKIIDWIPYLHSLDIGALLLNPIFDSDQHGSTQEISQKSTADLERIRISKMYVQHSMKRTSELYWMVYSIMLAADFGLFKMF